MESIFVSSFFVMLVGGLIGWGCQVYVAGKLKKSGYEGGQIITRSRTNFLVPLIEGWKHQKELGISGIMIFWSFMLGLTVLAGLVLIIAGATMVK
jgi:hypothetical protein